MGGRDSTQQDSLTCHSEPLVQNSPTTANVFIFMSFLIALFNYVRFAREVIWQMCVAS